MNPTHRAIHPRDDRETLSALFDGELPGDAARFALKRLDHDVSWRETCGRWQLIGDAMRGQATVAAPLEFAAGVMHALNAERPVGAIATPSAVSAQSVRVAPRFRWVGGAALAASVAMAAVLWVRPYSQDAASDPQVAASAGQAASSQQALAAQAPVASVPRSAGSTPADSVRTDRAGSVPVAAVAVAAAASRPAARRGEARARRMSQGMPAAGPSSNTAAAKVATASAAPLQPFHPTVDEITTRPWPRAALPETAAGDLTVGFGTAPAPTFYPFEPRLPASEKPPANESQR